MKTTEEKLEVLKEMYFPGFDKKLMQNKQNQFLVLTRVGERVKLEVYDDKKDAEHEFYDVKPDVADITRNGHAIPALSAR